MSGNLTGTAHTATIQTASINGTIASSLPNGYGAFLFFNLEPGLEPVSIYTLYPGACTVDGQENCTAACQDPNLVFFSLATLSSCMTAPYIASNFSALDQPSQSIARSFGITDKSLSPSAFNDTLSKCFSSFCAGNSRSCQQGESQSTLAALQGIPYQLGYRFNSIICPSASKLLDPDLGGIGIFISFVLQLSIALAGFALLLAFSSLGYYLTLWIVSGMGKVRAQSVARAVQSSLRKHRLALISALEEFHRTQCFFGLAVQVAAITVMRTGLLQAKTPAESLSNFSFMKLVASNSILSVPFTLWYLRDNTERSWYTHFLSLVTFSVSVATYVIATTATTVVMNYPPISNPGLPECGNVDPSSLCALDRTINGTNDLTILLAVIFMVWLSLDQIWHRSLRPFCQKRQPLNTRVQAIESFFNKGKRRQRVWFALWIVVKLSAFGFFIFLVTFQLHLLSGNLTDGAIQVWDWSIGQIVAVTVWAQPILEFVQLDLGVVKNGFSHRVPKGLEVIAATVQEQEQRYPPSWLDSVEDFFFSATRPPREHATPDSKHSSLQHLSRTASHGSLDTTSSKYQPDYLHFDKVEKPRTWL